MFYKKIDSTLRGHFARELGSIIDQAGLAIVAPAFPQAGRFTRNGKQYLNDTPLELTEIWRGEGITGTAHIPSMLERHGIESASIRIGEIRQGARGLRALLEKCARDGMQAVVCDVEAEDDLQAIAQASISLSMRRFWVGSAGLATYLPAAAHVAVKPVLLAPANTMGSILTVIGSLSRVSRAQAEYLLAAGQMERVEVPASVLRLAQLHPRWPELRDALEIALRKHRDLLVTIGMEIRSAWAKERGCAARLHLAVAQEIDAICTAPLNKEALHAGGHHFPGHTEMLAKLTHTAEVSMMLVAPNLRVIHVTTHIGLLDAIRKIEAGLVQRTIARGYDTLVRSGIAHPRIGVCGINPHAGENGLLGHGEEEEKIIPAVRSQRTLGRSVEGPLPADTLFFRAARGDFDLVVAMYHDQGHGPVKVMGLEAGVNITVGLPVIRTSVDHGTAFDIAGKGVAAEGSMLEALRQAIGLATRRS